jgi:hypothetical protein
MEDATIKVLRDDKWFPGYFDEAWDLLVRNPSNFTYCYGEDFDLKDIKTLHHRLSILVLGVEVDDKYRDHHDPADLSDREVRRRALEETSPDDDVKDDYMPCRDPLAYIDQPAHVVGDVTSCLVTFL